MVTPACRPHHHSYLIAQAASHQRTPPLFSAPSTRRRPRGDDRCPPRGIEGRGGEAAEALFREQEASVRKFRRRPSRIRVSWGVGMHFHWGVGGRGLRILDGRHSNEVLSQSRTERGQAINARRRRGAEVMAECGTAEACHDDRMYRKVSVAVPQRLNSTRPRYELCYPPGSSGVVNKGIRSVSHVVSLHS